MTLRSRIILFAFFSLIPLLASAQSGYHLIKKYPLTGDGGWDYVAYDNHAKRVYISHATHVLVFDADEEKIIGDILNTEGVHGIAFAQESGHGFTSNGKSNSVLMFDLKSLDTLKRITVGTKPDAIIYEPFSKSIIVCNGGSNNASVIDAKTGEVKHTVALGGAPEFAISDGKGHLYINLEDKNEVTDIDANKFKVLHHWKLSPGDGPTGIAMDKKTRRLFIGCANELMIIVNADNGKIVTKLPIGKRVDAVVFDPDKNLAISSNGEGTMTVVHETSPDKFEVRETVKTQPGAKTEALDPDSHCIYLITSDFGPVPEATKEHPHPRGAIIPNTFTLLKFGQ
jgi:YVTN family beta-propeller protein